MREVPTSSTNKRVVGHLRKALNRGHDPDPIRTVRGAGYALDDRFGKTA